MTEQIEFRHSLPIQIRFNDVDGQQHVNNAVYQSYFDIGREGYFSAIHEKDYHTGGKSFVIASVQTDFKKPVFRYDSIQVETAVTAIGNKSLEMSHRITGTDNDEIYATGTTIFAGFDYDRQETIILSEEIITAIEKYENRRINRK